MTRVMLKREPDDRGSYGVYTSSSATPPMRMKTVLSPATTPGFKADVARRLALTETAVRAWICGANVMGYPCEISVAVSLVPRYDVRARGSAWDISTRI